MIVDPPAPSASDALMRIDGPSISRLFRKKIGDSLKRKFFTGCEIFPFSMRYVPSRVRPVFTSVRGSTPRMYQKRVTRMPRSVLLIMSEIDEVPPIMRSVPPPPKPRPPPPLECVGSFPCFCAQKRAEVRGFSQPFFPPPPPPPPHP